MKVIGAKITLSEENIENLDNDKLRRATRIAQLIDKYYKKEFIDISNNQYADNYKADPMGEFIVNELINDYYSGKIIPSVLKKSFELINKKNNFNSSEEEKNKEKLEEDIETEENINIEVEIITKEEEEKKAKAEEEKRDREEAEKKAKAEEQKRAKEEAEKKAKVEEQKRAKEEEDDFIKLASENLPSGNPLGKKDVREKAKQLNRFM